MLLRIAFLAGTKLYCLVTEAHVCEQLAQGCYLAVERPGVEPATSRSLGRHATARLPSHIRGFRASIRYLYKFTVGFM